MKDKPIVSIASITYNHEKFIAQAIDSFLMQKTTFPFEIVIGEDCSTDNTLKIIEKYKQKYPDKIRLITSEKNIGMQANFVRTLKACRGKYIALCEGDDYWTDPLKLQKQVDFLEANEDYGLVHSDSKLEYVASKEIKNSKNSNNIFLFDEYNVFENIIKSKYPIFTCTVLFKKKLIDKFKFEEFNYFKMADSPLWLELSRITKFKYFSENTCVRRFLKESATQSSNINKKIEFNKSGYNLVKYFLEKYNCNDKIKKEALANRNKSLLSLAFEANDKELANKSYKNIVQYSGRSYLTYKDKIYFHILNSGINLLKNSYNFFIKIYRWIQK